MERPPRCSACSSKRSRPRTPLTNLQAQLTTSTHLARLAPRTGKLREAHDRLARCYARLSEGQGRAPAREAKAALDELAARLDAGTSGSVR
jgi:hypothetical protein